MKYLQNRQIYDAVILGSMRSAKRSVRIATANVKDVKVENKGEYASILRIIRDLCRRGVKVEILHSGIPSEPFLKDFKKYKLHEEGNFAMRRCLRVHFKCVLVDENELFFGSANLTGAGMGAKGENRRNFEIGILTDDDSIMNRISTLFSGIWDGKMCGQCGRKKVCYVPLEGPI